MNTLLSEVLFRFSGTHEALTTNRNLQQLGDQENELQYPAPLPALQRRLPNQSSTNQNDAEILPYSRA